MAKKAKKRVAHKPAARVHHHKEQPEHSPIMQIGIAFIIIAAILLMFYVGQYYSVKP